MNQLICKKIYRGVIAIILFFTLTPHIYAQTPTNGDYRSIVATGLWSSLSTWQVRSGGSWIAAASLPGSTSNVYIQNSQVITLSSTGNCKDLHISAGAGQLDCDGSLNIYGKLRRYNGTIGTSSVDAAFYSSQANGATSGTLIAGNQNVNTGIFFKGTTRNILNTGEWGVPGYINPYIHIEMNSGNTATAQTSFYANFLLITTGTLNMGTNSIFLRGGPAAFGSATIAANAILITANTGTANNNCIIGDLTGVPSEFIALYGKLILQGATPYVNLFSFRQFDGSTIEYGASGAQSFLKLQSTATEISSYRNLNFSGSGNKTPSGNFTVKEDLTISGSAVLIMGSKTATVTGNWTSYGTGGLNEGTSTIIFDSTGTQTINTTGGENFYALQKNNTGTLTFNSNVAIAAGGNLNLSSGTIDAGTNSFTGTTTSALNMSNGTLKLGKLSTTLPEFTITSYNISGGTIELNGAGTQTLRGARDYRNLTFSNSGTKGITSAINNITGTVRVANTAILDVGSNTMGGTGTNLTMTGTSVYKTAGSSQVKPDAAGTYTLGIGTTIEFTNSLAGLESIRFIGAATVSYYNISVSGSSVGTASLATGIRFQTGGTFTVKTNGTFKHTNTTGFSGNTTTAISNTNNPLIVLETGSTIEYNGSNQTISNQTISSPADAHYQNLKLSNSGNKTAPAGTLTIKGNLDKEGTVSFVHNSGTVVMNGTAAQDYTSTTPFIDFYNFTNNNTVDLSINSEMSIEKEIAFGSSSKLNLQTAANIILLSTNSATANVGIIPSNATVSYSGNGKFTVHRYIETGSMPNHGKSWQFLAIPTNGGQTINQAWQDTATAANQSRYGGYGIQITSNISPLPSRFDVYTSNGASMKTYTATSNSWTGVANTTATSIYNAKGYLVFVRGDRTITTYNATANQTILRTGGRIFWPVSNTPPTTSVLANMFESIGNPYASAINFSNDAGVLKSTNIQRVFYVWDPRLGGHYGYGAYQTFTRGVGADNNYYVSPGGGSYGAIGSINNVIQSGQAFFVRATGGSGTVSFNENAKTSGSSTTFRPTPSPTATARLFIQLKQVNNADTVLLDGVMDEFGRELDNDIDPMDAHKFTVSTESISIDYANTELAVERRNFPSNNDTLFLKTSNLKAGQYQLCFSSLRLDEWEMKAFLVDNFLHTSTAINLANGSNINFSINSSAASYAANRFVIVFKQKTEFYPAAEYSFTKVSF